MESTKNILQTPAPGKQPVQKMAGTFGTLPEMPAAGKKFLLAMRRRMLLVPQKEVIDRHLCQNLFSISVRQKPPQPQDLPEHRTAVPELWSAQAWTKHSALHKSSDRKAPHPSDHSGRTVNKIPSPDH